MSAVGKWGKTRVIRVLEGGGGLQLVGGGGHTLGRWSHLVKVALSRHLKVKESAAWTCGGRAFQEEGAVSAKTL